MPRTSQDDKHFLGMAGEFLIAAELNRRHMLAAVTYGAAKSADVWAFAEESNRAVRVEVKTTTTRTGEWLVGSKALVREGWNPEVFWVLVLLPPAHPATTETNDELRGQHSPRFFVFTSEEIGGLVCERHDRYRAKYFDQHNREFEGQGVLKLSTNEALSFESEWHKLERRVK